MTWIRFVNRTDVALDLHWVDEGGERRFHATVPPRTSRSQAAAPGQAWVAIDHSGKERGFYHADPQPRAVELSGPPWVAGVLIALPDGFTPDASRSGYAGRDRVLSGGAPIVDNTAAMLDEHDAGWCAIEFGRGPDDSYCQLALFELADEEKARAFAAAHLELYDRFLAQMPSAGTFDVPDGYGVRGLFTRHGGGASAWFASGRHVGRVTIASGDTDADVDEARRLAAAQRQALT